MNIILISVIVALALLLLKMEIPSKRIDDFIRLYHTSLSKLEEEKIKNIAGKPVDKENDKGMDEINKCFKEFKKGYDVLKWLERLESLKLFLPTLLTIEILHIALQEFGWSLWYEGMWPGLNGKYVVFLILLMLLYFTIIACIVITLSKEKILGLETQIISVIGRYIYGSLYYRQKEIKGGEVWEENLIHQRG